MGAKWPRTQHTHYNTPRVHTGEREPTSQEYLTRNATHQAGTPVNKSQLVKDTAQATQHTERAHRSTGAKWPRKPHTQSNTPSGHTGERKPRGQGHCTDSTPSGHTCEGEPSGQGHRTYNTTHGAGTPVIGTQVAKETAHASQHTKRAHR